jgi:hypothetical protein
VTVGGDTVASTRPLDADEDGDSHLALTVLAFVLLLGSAAGLARELASRSDAAAPAASAVA